MQDTELNTAYITQTAGLAHWVIELIDDLLPLLPGNDPTKYVTESGRPNIDMIMRGATPHTHSTKPIADFILETWNGTGAMMRFLGHADKSRRATFADAMHRLGASITT